jgi:hypothetical protein
MAGFLILGSLATFIGITRPNRVRLRYGSQVRLPRLRPADCSAARWVSYMVNEQFP